MLNSLNSLSFDAKIHYNKQMFTLLTNTRVQLSNMPHQVKCWLKALSLGLLVLDTLKAAIYQ